MKRIKPSLKGQRILFAEHYIDDRLSTDHDVYAFDALLEKIDLSAIVNSYGSSGGELFAPRDMIAILLYAYSKGITSSYKIANEIRSNIAFIYLAGGQIIHRRTICDFRKRNVEHLRPLLSSTIQNAISVDLLHEDVIFALDGSKFSADASKSKTKTKDDWEARRVKIQRSVENYFDELEKNDDAEDGIEEENARKHEERMRKIRELKMSNNKMEARDARRAERMIREANRIDMVLEAHPDLKPTERVNITEPESRLMKNGTGEYLQGFNAQIITSNQIICAADLVQDENDQACLIPMVEALEKEIPVGNSYKLLTDAGYNKGTNLKWLAGKENIDAYVSMNDRKEDAKSDLEKAIGRSAFEYDENEDHFICPTGKALNFQRTRTSGAIEYSIYRADHNDCQKCSGRHSCLLTVADKKAGAKIIEDDGTLSHRNAMKEKMSRAESKRIYAERAIEPEPVWGQMKKNLGIRRFRMRTFSSMCGEFVLTAIASNLSKLIRFQVKQKMATV